MLIDGGAQIRSSACWGVPECGRLRDGNILIMLTSVPLISPPPSHPHRLPSFVSSMRIGHSPLKFTVSCLTLSVLVYVDISSPSLPLPSPAPFFSFLHAYRSFTPKVHRVSYLTLSVLVYVDISSPSLLSSMCIDHSPQKFTSLYLKLTLSVLLYVDISYPSPPPSTPSSLISFLPCV